MFFIETFFGKTSGQAGQPSFKPTENPTISGKKNYPFFIFIVLRRYWVDFEILDVLNSPDSVLSNFDTFVR